MKMIQLLNLGKNASHATILNFVAQKDKVFLMDNHLAALWCWLQIIDTTKEYNLFHIDRHYDLIMGNEKEIVKELMQKSLSLKNIPIEDLTKETYIIDNSRIQSFTWDNYFSVLSELYPCLLDEVHFATHKKGCGNWKIDFTEQDIYSLPENLSYWIESATRQNGKKWIVNVDLDYFFLPNPCEEEPEWELPSTEKHYQFLSNDYIKNIAKEIVKSADYIDVLTICLSPECCGGWENAIKVGKIFFKHLGLKFPKISTS